MLCDGVFVFHSKNGKVQKRGKMNLIGRLQLSTERSKEEDNEGIIQLRIFRVQVIVHSTSLWPRSSAYLRALHLFPDLFPRFLSWCGPGKFHSPVVREIRERGQRSYWGGGAIEMGVLLRWGSYWDGGAIEMGELLRWRSYWDGELLRRRSYWDGGAVEIEELLRWRSIDMGSCWDGGAIEMGKLLRWGNYWDRELMRRKGCWAWFRWGRQRILY